MGVHRDERVHDLEAVAVIEVESAGIIAVGELGGLEDVGPFANDGVLGTKRGVEVGILASREAGGTRCEAGGLLFDRGNGLAWHPRSDRSAPGRDQGESSREQGAKS